MKPDKVGKYVVLDEISRGGMGIVYKGKDESLDRTVAIKMLPKEFFVNTKHKERFQLEARIVAKLDHPNIMDVYAYEEAYETVWIVMEFLKGEILQTRIKRLKKLPVDDAISIIEQIASSLQYAHERGIVHRDIKPANVMILDENSRVKMMDFGIAYDQAQSSDLNLTQEGTIIGTPKYMAPEQFSGGEVDARSDIYSLGVMAYEMISGELPFIGKNLPEMAYKHMQAVPEPIDKKVPEITRELASFIMKALSKKKEDRPSSLKGLRLRPSEFETVTIEVRKVSKKARIYKFVLILVILGLGMYAIHQKMQKVKMKASIEANIASKKSAAEKFIEDGDLLKAKSVLAELGEEVILQHKDLKALIDNADVLIEKRHKQNKAQEMFGIALEKISQERLDEHAEYLAKAIMLYPEKANEFSEKAKESLQSYKKNEAQKLFDQAVQYAFKLNFEESNLALKKCLALNPEYFDAYRLLAENFWDLGNIQKVVENYKIFLSKDPYHENIWLALSKAESQLGLNNDALDSCEKALILYPDSQELINLKKDYLSKVNKDKA